VKVLIRNSNNWYIISWLLLSFIVY
jgi:hypothetical protein